LFACFPPGALLLGDAFNMKHPLTGGGMTVENLSLPVCLLASLKGRFFWVMPST
jgi:hypothetical protein